MGGGLMQLVAYGAQDIYITGNPQITFFKVVYRRHTNFSVECIKQDFVGNIGTSESSVTTTIGRNGDLLVSIQQYQPDVVLELTDAKSVYKNSKLIIKAGVHPVIGASGLQALHIDELTGMCATKKLGGIIVPNFSIGATLMIQLAKWVSQTMKEVEIIEYDE